ncbi:MAG: Uma2 family endonuclease [Thermosynechococcaceae cyanobacterium]
MTATLIQTQTDSPIISWRILPDDFVLPDDPVEDQSQYALAVALLQALTTLPALMQDALIVTNFALCADVRWDNAPSDDNSSFVCKAPDWMYVRPVAPGKGYEPRRSYTPHAEGPIPQVVMEFLSHTYGEEYSVEFTQRVGKWYFYERIIQVPIYVIFSGKTGHLEVYALESERYVLQKADANGRYSIPSLELFLGVWEGTRDCRTGYWLRWWTPQGELLLWPEERLEQERQRAEQERQRAEQERQRADALAERLRELGVDLP